tara:strand:- start:1805 stop:2320 length:516 start_codon:yes stop_codon:yes gene_type:complete
MTLQLILLCGLYVGLSLLVLYLIASSSIPWMLRLGIAVLVTLGYFASWTLWRDMAGWPARAVLPDRFLFHAATIIEPDDEKAEPGVIHVWATELLDEGPDKRPRSYQVPYLKSLHSKIQEAEARMRNGRPQIGHRESVKSGGFTVDGAMRRDEDEQQFNLGDLASPALPEK